MNFCLSLGKTVAIFITITAILTTNMANAAIRNSSYEERHQLAIEKSIFEKCGISGQLLQVSNQQTKVQIDNGIIDINYTTTIVVRSGVDQYLFEEFTIVVNSLYADAYDHESKNWGVYTVESLSSADRNCK